MCIKLRLQFWSCYYDSLKACYLWLEDTANVTFSDWKRSPDRHLRFLYFTYYLNIQLRPFWNYEGFFLITRECCVFFSPDMKNKMTARSPSYIFPITLLLVYWTSFTVSTLYLFIENIYLTLLHVAYPTLYIKL